MAVSATIEIESVFNGEDLTVRLTLPFPPSVNAIWKFIGAGTRNRRRVIRDPAYSTWIKTCDGCCLEQLGISAYRRTIKGRYSLVLALDLSCFGRVDQDNCVKAVSDFLQRARIIENDRWAWQTMIVWSEIENSHEFSPLCHVTVKGI